MLGGRTGRPSLVRPVRPAASTQTTGDPGSPPSPLSFAACHCFQAVLLNTSRSVFPSAGRRVHTGLPRGGGTCRTLQYQHPSLFPDPLTRPPDCRRQAPPIPVGQSAEWPCYVHSGHRVLKLSSGRPRPPSILDGRSAYRYAVLILLPPSQSHTMAHHPGFPILL